MTSFAFEGPALDGPAHGRVLLSHTRTYSALYLLQCDAMQQQAKPLIQAQRVHGTFRYCAHRYGKHQFFLPAHQTLSYFIKVWNPPVDQTLWPAFLQYVIDTLSKASR